MQTRKTVLVVDDEDDIITLLEYNFRRDGYHVLTARDGGSALDLLRRTKLDLVILDLMLPDMSGTEILKQVKSDRATQAIPVILLTARVEEVDRILHFELGADDYVTKPFSPRELILRARAVLKRLSEYVEHPGAFLRVGPIEIDLERHTVRILGKEIYLTVTEFRLLADLARARGRVRSRDALLAEIWGYDSDVMSRTVDTHIRRLREKLGPAALWLQTMRGVGYRVQRPNEGGPAIDRDPGPDWQAAPPGA